MLRSAAYGRYAMPDLGLGLKSPPLLQFFGFNATVRQERERLPRGIIHPNSTWYQVRRFLPRVARRRRLARVLGILHPPTHPSCSFGGTQQCWWLPSLPFYSRITLPLHPLGFSECRCSWGSTMEPVAVACIAPLACACAAQPSSPPELALTPFLRTAAAHTIRRGRSSSTL